MSRLEQVEELCVDTETSGLDPWRKSSPDRVCGIAIAIDGGKEAYYFPFRHADRRRNLPVERIRGDFGPLLSNPERLYLGFNYKFDLKFLSVEGIGLPERIHDPHLAAHLCDENEFLLGLKPLSDKYLGKGSSQAQHDLDEKLREWGYTKDEMWRLDPADVEPYACDDVRLTWKLRDYYIKQLDKQQLYDLWIDTCEYSNIVTEMEITGLKINEKVIRDNMSEARVKHLEEVMKIRDASGRVINPASSKQVCAWLGISSSAAEVLDALKDKDPRAQMILDARGWQSVNSKYYKPLLRLRDENGVGHPNFRLTGTISSRMSSSKPFNWQAFPRYTEVFKVKDAIEAREGMVLVEADYSQAEIRVACHYGREERMGALVESGADIHSTTAEEIDIPRWAAKRINFSVIYGIGKRTLSERLNITEAKAGEYLRKYHSLYPGFRRLYNKAEQVAAQRGFIQMFSGRRRHFNSHLAETHKASSNLVQGAVAEMIRIAQTRVHRELRGEGVEPRLQVHDSSFMEIPEDKVEELVPEIRRIMEHQPWCDISHKVDVKVGKTWGNMKPVEV